MLDRIKALLLEDRMKGAARHYAGVFSDREIAMAVLFLEAAESDGDYGRPEHEAILGLISRKFGCDMERAKVLVATAEPRQKQAVELYRFTDTLVRSLDEKERITLVEMLWEVVYADGMLDAFEDNLMRRLGGLLHVSERDRGDARRRVLARKQAGEEDGR